MRKTVPSKIDLFRDEIEEHMNTIAIGATLDTNLSAGVIQTSLNTE